MSQEKAQLIAPQGHFTVPGLNVAGVVTASSFSGNCTGTASSLAQGSNLVVGVMTASSFAGDVVGNAAGLSTTTAGLKLGIVTATSFAGNFTGIGSGLTGTPNIVAGLVTASQFIGNTPGLAAGLSAGKNLNAGIITATTFHGDGSNLTGAGSTAFIRQTVQATDSTTTINLSNGNIIYYEGAVDTTVSFANTGTSNDVTIIRTLSSTFDVAYNESFSAAAVDFNGSNQKLEMSATADFHFGTDDFTMEAFVNRDADTNPYPRIFNFGPFYSSNDTVGLCFDDSDYPGKLTLSSYRNRNQGTVPSNARVLVSDTTVTTGQWYHVAVTRKDGIFRMFIDGALEDTNSSIPNRDLEDSSTNTLAIAGTVDRMVEEPFDGKISNVRIINGTCLYDEAFLPPSADLTNVTNTKLLCCQTSGNAQAAAVVPTGGLSDAGSPTASSYTIAYSGTNALNLSTSITWPSSIKWNGGSAPTLLGANTRSTAGQVFNLITADTGTNWYGYEEVNSDPQTLGLFSWGKNAPGVEGGVLGHNDLVTRSSPTQIGSDLTWSKWTAGQYSGGRAIKSDGTLWTWGWNSNGMQGQNNTSPGYSSPVQIPGTIWDSVTSNSYVTFATKTDNTLWAWGSSGQQLGINGAPGDRRSSPVQIPGSWATGSDKLSTSGEFTGAIKTDGTLWTWGLNLMGNLGINNASNNHRSSPVQVPGTTWSTFGTAGGYSSLAVKTDGTLWSWGYNENGQLGLNGPVNNDKSSPTQVGSDSTWVRAMGSWGKSVVGQKTDNTFWTWGMNQYGQLGHNDNIEYSSPVQIPGSWSRMVMARFHMMGVKTDGTLWTWGRNDNSGQLGQNNLTQYSSPVQVPGTKWTLDGCVQQNGYTSYVAQKL